MAREIKISQDEKSINVEIPRIGPWGDLLRGGFWCLVWLFIFYTLIRSGVLEQHPDMGISMIGFALLWLFVFRVFLWNAMGREKIKLTRQELTIRRAGTFLTLTRKYEVDLIDEFRYTDTIDVPRLSWRYGFAGGYISFNYWERPEYFGESVTKAEAENIAGLLNDWLKIRRMQNSHMQV